MIIRTGNWDGINKALNAGNLAAQIEKHGALASKRAGLLLEGRIRKQIRKVSSPPNHPITIERKGSSKPLQDTNQLTASVTHIVLAPLIVWVGIPEGISHKETGASLALIATVLNGGQFGKVPKDTIIVPKNAKALFIPLRRDVEPDDPGLKRGVDFVLAKSVRIRARPFLPKAVEGAQGRIIKIYEAAAIAAFRSLLRG